MSQRKLDTHQVVKLLLKDALPTLGERARGEVLRLAANYASVAEIWMKDGQSLEEAQRSLDAAVVDGLQQAAHDLFWDTTWPSCPRHRQHPLWYDETLQAWQCKEEPAIVTPLGRLADLFT